jgi:hypothetical protein
MSLNVDIWKDTIDIEVLSQLNVEKKIGALQSLLVNGKADLCLESVRVRYQRPSSWRYPAIEYQQDIVVNVYTDLLWCLGLGIQFRLNMWTL